MQNLKPATYLTKQERQQLLQKNDWKATFQLLHIWFWIAAAFALVYCWTNVLTVVVALFILGGQQLACSIVMHDASHFSMFKSKKVNDFVGKWLGSYWIWNDLLRYRPYHLQHHLHTGSEDDPDLGLTVGYPTTLRSMVRKFTRDLTGLTGIKTQVIGNAATHLGLIEYNLGGGKVKKITQDDRSILDILAMGIRNLAGPALVHGFLWLVLWLVGAPWLILLWFGALLTTYNFSLRVRSMAEHSMVENTTNQQKNTRTTYANWLERLLFAPLSVNYHLEHHLLMSVPSYNLPRMHQILLERGFYKEAPLEKGYWRIIKMATKDMAKSS